MGFFVKLLTSICLFRFFVSSLFLWSPKFFIGVLIVMGATMSTHVLSVKVLRLVKTVPLS